MRQSISRFRVMLFFTALLVAVCCGLLYRFDNKYTYPGNTGADGAVLSGLENPQDGALVFLTRDWQSQRLSPADSSVSPFSTAAEHTKTPWTDPAYTTYRQCVPLPVAPYTYTLWLPDQYTAVSVSVNGVPIPYQVAANQQIQTATFHAGTQADIVVSAIRHPSIQGEQAFAPALGSPQAVTLAYANRRSIRVLLCFLAVLAGLANLIYGLFHRDFPGACYGFLCLLVSGFGSYPFWLVLGVSSTLLWRRIEALLYCLALLLILVLQRQLYQLSWIFLPLAALFCAGIFAAFVLQTHPFRSPVSALVLSFFLDRYQLVLAGFFLVTPYCFAKKALLSPLLPQLGVTAFGTALLLQGLALPFEPIVLGQFGEVGGMLLVVCLSGHPCLSAMRIHKTNLTLRRQLASMEERTQAASRQLTLQQCRLRELREDIDAIRRIRHDFRHHMTLLSGLLNVDLPRAKEYLAELNATLPASQFPLCENTAVDALLRQYTAIAQQENISLETTVNLVEIPGISDLDLCIVLGNLLENAVDALRQCPAGLRRFLKISAGLTGRVLTINVDNSFPPPPKGQTGRGPSPKRIGQGIGLRSIRAVARRYEGDCWWRTENGVFRASVVLKAKGQVYPYEDCSV